jgi:hypothetical protein
MRNNSRQFVLLATIFVAFVAWLLANYLLTQLQRLLVDDMRDDLKNETNLTRD